MSEEWTDFSESGQEKLAHLIAVMYATLQKQTYGQKIGIAAPQIGEPYRVAIVLNKIYINPVITLPKTPPIEVKEGCYSTGVNIYKVDRAPYCWVKYQDVSGEHKEERVKNLEAIVLQHEVGHLDGKCVPDVGKLTEEKIPQSIKK